MTHERKSVANALVVLILVALALWAPRAFPALVMELVDDTLFLSGYYIEREDWVRYREVTQGKRFSKVVTVNLRGGWYAPALGIADDLIKRRVQTIALGYCKGTCPVIFLAGERRQFAGNSPLSGTELGFVSMYHPYFKTQLQGRGNLAAYFGTRVSGQALELITRATDNLADNRGFLSIHHPAHRSYAVFCSGSREEKCERVSDSDALTLGLITSGELVAVSLPQKLVAKDLFLGVDPAAFERIAEPSDAEKYCPDGAPGCIRSMRALLERPLERALAISESGKTGMSWQYKDARRAAWRAAYQCVRNALEPCRIVAVNDFVTHELYAVWQRESTEAIEALRKTRLEEIPQERYEQTELRMSRLRTDTFVGPTPESIPGVKEVVTRELVKMLTGGAAIELVDVWCGDQTVPTAKCIFGGGLAYATSSTDQAQEKLLLVLLDGLAAGKPVVVFSNNSQNWLSANAALRAAKSGKSVYWYRGGVDAWRAAGLPTVPTAPFGAAVE
jgi:rhodanese-related sulfurtransferase